MQATPALPYDSKVSYLETTGAQRVITDIVVPNTNTEIKVYSILKDTSGSSTSRVIVSSGGSGKSAALQFYASSGRWFVGTTSIIKSNSVFQSVTAIRKGADNTNSIEISGGGANNGTDNGRDASDQYIVLSAFYSGNLKSNNQQNKIISIHFDNLIVARMIPVRVGTVGYWYDEINNKMWRSDTGTDYIAGPDIQ